LLCKDPNQRLGSSARGADDVKAHPFFSSVSWPQVLHKELSPPKPGNPDLFAKPLKSQELRFESTSEASTLIPGWEFVREQPPASF